jgi:hypothetical protein
MKRTLIAFAVAAALPLTALAQTGSPSAPSKSPSSAGSSSPGSGMSKDSPLSRLDTNKDGYVSKNEAKGSAEVSKHFSTLDKDHDGKLSSSELSAASSGSSSSGSSSPSGPKSGGTSPGSGGSPKSKY